MKAGRPRILPPELRKQIAAAYLNAPFRPSHRGKKRRRMASYWSVSQQFGVTEKTVQRCVAEARGLRCE